MSLPVRWLTCAPRDFNGNEEFFARDTGLLCRGLQEAGVECHAVLCGDPRPDDVRDLIRASLKELENPGWWRDQGAQVVVLHTWSSKKFTGVLRAIKGAGSRVILLQDGTGVTGPLGSWGDWLRESWYLKESRGGVRGLLWFAARMIHGHSLRLWRFEKDRFEQLALADKVVVPSPGALAGYRKLCRSETDKLSFLPHPVASRFHWEGAPAKENLVVAIGRWDDFWQKRPDLLACALQQCLARHEGWRAEIYGEPASLLEWHGGLEPSLAGRIRLVGRVSNCQVGEALGRAKMILCSSAHESFHMASGEALCCGASVVGTDNPLLPSLRWFVSANSGTLAGRLKGSALATAAANEMSKWERGARDPLSISGLWRSRLHAVEVARGLILLAREFP
jgi:glycosyltransferase involved in cell wall biosynthesis